MNKPIIGIVGRVNKNEKENIFVYDEYRSSIVQVGGIPILILPTYNEGVECKKAFEYDLTNQEKDDLIRIINLCDGFLFPGGINWYGFDQFILDYAYENDIPVLGICCGMQMMGCRSFFHEECSDKTMPISSVNNHYVEAGYVHSVSFLPSKLKEIIRKDDILVTSRHHYQIPFEGDYLVSALSSDGVVEAIEIPEKHFFIGVQWHPEATIKEDETSKRLFQAFIDASRK